MTFLFEISFRPNPLLPVKVRGEQQPRDRQPRSRGAQAGEAGGAVPHRPHGHDRPLRYAVVEAGLRRRVQPILRGECLFFSIFSFMIPPRDVAIHQETYYIQYLS